MLRDAILQAHRESLEEWARMYEADGTSSIAFDLRRCARQIGRLMGDTTVPHEPMQKEPATRDVPADLEPG